MKIKWFYLCQTDKSSAPSSCNIISYNIFEVTIAVNLKLNASKHFNGDVSDTIQQLILLQIQFQHSLTIQKILALMEDVYSWRTMETDLILLAEKSKNKYFYCFDMHMSLINYLIYNCWTCSEFMNIILIGLKLPVILFISGKKLVWLNENQCLVYFFAINLVL